MSRPAEPSIRCCGPRARSPSWRTDLRYVCCSRREDLPHRCPHGRPGTVENLPSPNVFSITIVTLHNTLAWNPPDLALCGARRARWWLWTGSGIRLIEFFITPRCSTYVPSRPIASTVFRLFAVTLHGKLKVTSHLIEKRVHLLCDPEHGAQTLVICRASVPS